MATDATHRTETEDERPPADSERERRARGWSARRDYRPTGAAPKTGLFATLKRTATEFQEDNLTDWAAALTYYGLLSLFPALIALVALVGLFGDPKSTTQTITDR